MSPLTRRLTALVGAAALVVPSAAAAHGGHGKPEKHHATGKSKPSKPAKPAKRAAYVFKGVWHADGSVTVTGGNARVRQGHFVGEVVTFDLAGAKLRAADTNGSGAVDATDLVEGDKVVVQARLPRTEPARARSPPASLSIRHIRRSRTSSPRAHRPRRRRTERHCHPGRRVRAASAAA